MFYLSYLVSARTFKMGKAGRERGTGAESVVIYFYFYFFIDFQIPIIV